MNTSSRSGSLRFGLSLLGIAACAAGPAVAQTGSEQGSGGLEEITVTASRQGATNLQSTPLAVSAFSGDALAGSFATNIKDLVQMTPNLNIAQVTASAAIYIRGIGTNAVFNGSDPDVAVNVDGVYMARAFAQFTDFVDIDRIEVLRGPQGTLYGRNAVGGVINIITRRPGESLAGAAQVTIGDYGALQGQGYISGPIAGDTLKGSIAVNYMRRDGYSENIVPGRPDLGNADRGGFRASLLWTPTDQLEFMTRIDHAQLDEDIQAYDQIRAPLPYPTPLANSLVGQFHKVAQNNPQTNDETLEGVSEDITFRINDKFALRSISAFRHSKYEVFTDTDASELTINNARQFDNSRQFSQEFNLTGNIAATDFVAGLYYFREKQESINQGLIPPSAFTPTANAIVNRAHPITHASSQAAFFQVTQHITPAFSVTAGARYTKDRKELDLVADRFRYPNPPVFGDPVPGFPFIAHVEPSFDAYTPKLGVEWQVTDEHLLYASFSKGFKSGGNNFAATNLVGITYQPEKITSYEVGAKTQWFDRRLRANLSLFDYDYANLQVQSLIGPGNTQIANAASASVRGVELETQSQVSQHFVLTVNLAWLDTEYENFGAATSPGGLVPYLLGDPRFNATARTYNATGNRLNAAPEWSGSAAAEYNVPVSSGNWFGRAEYYFQDRVFYDPSNALILSQGGYGLVNASVGYDASAGWSAQLGVKNALDKGYFYTLAGNGAVPSGISGAPRTVLLRLSKEF